MITSLSAAACGPGPNPAPSGTCSDLRGTWSFGGGTCPFTSDCTVTQTGCAVALSCANGARSVSGSVSANEFNFALATTSGGTETCQGAWVDGKLNASCGAGSKTCSIGATLVSGPGDAGSSDANGDASADILSRFVGAPWKGTDSRVTTCGGATSTSKGPVSLSLRSNGQGLTFKTAAGCVFDFTVAGDTASLSNAPVSCHVLESDGTAVLHTVTSYTLQTADGRQMTGEVQGTDSSPGRDCSFTSAANYTR